MGFVFAHRAGFKITNFTIDPFCPFSVSHDDVPWSPCVPLGISWSLGETCLLGR